jgi:hypothetical protein
VEENLPRRVGGKSKKVELVKLLFPQLIVVAPFFLLMVLVATKECPQP